jgi:Mn2+/Fe2+ NRAMP family transporter
LEKKEGKEEELLKAAASLPLYKKAWVYLKLMGPGIMVASLFIGGATVVTAANLGYSYGPKWLWLALLGVISYGVVNWSLLKLTIYGGDDWLSLLKKHIHILVYVFSVLSLLIVNTIFHTTQVFLSSTIFKYFFNLPIIGGVILTIAIAALISFSGREAAYIKVIGWIMHAMVWMLFIIFAATLFRVPVNWGEVLGGFVPKLPGSIEEAIAVSGFLASTVGVQQFILMSSSTKQRGWSKVHLGLGAAEISLSSILFLLVNFLLIIVFAYTLGVAHIKPTGLVGASTAIEPTVGSLATVLFLIGVWFCVITSVTMQVLITGQTLSNVLGWPLDVSKRKFKGISALVFIFAFIVPFIGLSPIAYVIYATAFNSIFTPLFIIFTIYLINSKKVVGEGKAGWILNVFLFLALIISIVGIIGFLVSII